MGSGKDWKAIVEETKISPLLYKYNLNRNIQISQ
jgi:hypothetical protein